MTNRQRNTRLIIAIIFLMVLTAVTYCRAKQVASAGESPVATPDTLTEALLTVETPSTLPNIPLQYIGMNIGFNPSLHIPNWVAWHLTDQETQGSHPRTNKFLADDNVESSAQPWDYSYSGYDRGHMAPAGDMKWSPEAIAQSFLMTNIVPQAKTLNTGTWKRLEEKCRTWARAKGEIIIVCGPVNTEKPIEYIGDSHVAVPQQFYKAIISLTGDTPRGIGFIMPNGKVPGGLQKAAVTIDEIEQLTGLDFFSALPDDIENDIESQCDFHYWSTLKAPAQ